MHGIRHGFWGVLLLVSSGTLQAQPWPKYNGGNNPDTLPGGQVVGRPAGSSPVSTPSPALLPVLQPVKETQPTPPPPLKTPDPVEPPKAELPVPSQPTPTLPTIPADAPVQAILPGGPGSAPIDGSGCCWPVGGDGPISEEVYIRYGIVSPQGDQTLARNLKRGQSAQLGARTQLFDPSGDAAWAIDAHVVYSYNRGTNGEIITVRGEPTTLRALHRTSVGLGVGRDWFFWRPGFILDTWDTNFRLGADVGGRWGAGHVDLDTPFEEGGYRRRYDVFGQAFGGMTGTMEVPMGGFIWMLGARVEVDYTFSDLIPRGGSFYQIGVLGMFGVRY